MGAGAVAAFLLLALSAVAVEGAPTQQPAVAAPVQLSGVTAAEAGALVGKLQDLQARLRRGEALVFELLAGAPASWPTTEIPPRALFLQARFDRVHAVDRVATDNRLWQPYRLALRPERPGQPVWDVEIVLGVNGDVERVEMVYRPAPPF